MRVSLQFLFAVTTLVGLLALVYREEMLIVELSRQNLELNKEIAAAQGPMHEYVDYLSRAADARPAYNDLVKTIEAGNSRLLKRWQEQAPQREHVSVFNNRSAKELTPQPVFVSVPPRTEVVFRNSLLDNESNEIISSHDLKLDEGINCLKFEMPTQYRTGGIVLDGRYESTFFTSSGDEDCVFAFRLNDKAVKKIAIEGVCGFSYPRCSLNSRIVEVDSDVSEQRLFEWQFSGDQALLLTSTLLVDRLTDKPSDTGGAVERR